MPKAIINALTDVSEPLRTEYRPGTADEGLDGRFVLIVEGQDGWNLENVAGLKTALSTERSEHSALKSNFKAFEGLDPKAARDAIAKVAELGTLDPKKDMDRLVQEKVDAQLGQLNDRHGQETGQLKKRIESRDGLIRGIYQRDAVSKAISAEKGDVDLLLPHVLPSVQFDLDEADDGTITPRVKVVDSKGNVRIGDNSGNAMTIEQHVKEMKKDAKFSRLFESEGHQGTGDRNNPGGGGGGYRPSGSGKIADMSRKDKAALIGQIGQQAYNERVNAERANA